MALQLRLDDAASLVNLVQCSLDRDHALEMMKKNIRYVPYMNNETVSWYCSRLTYQVNTMPQRCLPIKRTRGDDHGQSSMTRRSSRANGHGRV